MCVVGFHLSARNKGNQQLFPRPGGFCLLRRLLTKYCCVRPAPLVATVARKGRMVLNKLRPLIDSAEEGGTDMKRVLSLLIANHRPNSLGASTLSSHAANRLVRWMVVPVVLALLVLSSESV